jgi:hypothetical protein
MSGFPGGKKISTCKFGNYGKISVAEIAKLHTLND